MRNDIILEDTTLRDGEQAPGIAFSKKIKLEILEALIGVGVRWIEVGIPAMGGEETETLKEMLERKYEARLIAWNRGVKEDIEHSIALGFNAIHIGLPTSDIHLANSVQRSRKWVLNTGADLVKFAKDKGVFVSISAEDVGRTEISFLQEYACAMEAAGADRLRLSDTIGILGPEEYARRVASVVSVSKIDTQCHCHNDFGLAVANTLAGLHAGARYFHVCVNAMGERAGMPDLAQTCMALKHLYKTDVGIDTIGLTKLSALVAKASHQTVAPWQPIVGRNVFAHESGIHAKGMLKDEKTFEPFNPEEVGGERRYVTGKHSGRNVIKYALQQMGVEPEEELLNPCLAAVRQASIDRGGDLSPNQLKDVYEILIASNMNDRAKSHIRGERISV